MCTGETRQELLFLLSFEGEANNFPKIDFASRMETKVKELGWPAYFVLAPLNIDQLTEKAAHFQYIEKASPFAWRLSPMGTRRAKHIVETYLPERERPKLVKFLPKELA